MAKLLLVEDDNNLREIYEARLQAEGYTIVSAKDGEEALVVAKAEKPDLIISDVMMPKISGFEMLDILRNTDELKAVKVIMLTALGQSDDQQRADKLGADRYLVKSQVTLEDIVKVTHELLEGESAPAAAAPAEPAVPKPETPAPATEAPAEAAPDAEPASAPASAAEPPAEPKPEPKTDDAADAKPDPDTSATNEAAKSTTQEEADVEAKIEDFVAGASSEPTAPSDAPATPAAATDAKDDTKSSSDASTDDKLISDAADDLVASTDKTDSGAESSKVIKPTVIPVSTDDDKPDDKPETAKPKEEAEDKKEDDAKDKPEKPAGGSGGSMDRDKVIKPLEETEHKKDIKELLADEEAKEAQTVPGNVITVDTPEEDKPSGGPAPSPSAAAEESKDAGGVDPNSIAL